MTKQQYVAKDTLDRMMAFEEGAATVEQTIDLFQELIDSGLVWKLQGSYGRFASNLIRQGHCKLNKKAFEQ